MNLYKVTYKGMTNDCMETQNAHGIAYVVAENPDIAYKKLREHLDKERLGFHKERELKTIELIASVGKYPSCGCALFL